MKGVGDELESADHYSALMVLSKMLDYELQPSNGDALSSKSFKTDLEQLQEAPNYLTDLKARASARLYSGTEIEKNHVFWDYTNIATLDETANLRQGPFREEFIQASLLHFDYLIEMNKQSEIKSRLDYIRWSFSPLLSDERMATYL